MFSRRVSAALCIGFGWTLAAPLAVWSNNCCPGDLGEMDGEVGPTDLAFLLASWGACGGVPCEADLDSDDVVGPADLAILLGNWGPCTFQYGPPLDNAEAEQIALEMLGPGGPLLPVLEDYLRIDRDLALIRTGYPILENVLHTGLWQPANLNVELADQGPGEQYLCLNSFYQPEVDPSSNNRVLLIFLRNLNMPALAQIYEQAPSVVWATTCPLVGQGTSWQPTPLAEGTWRWDLTTGYGDCQAGCICHCLYTFLTDAEGNVTLVSQFAVPSWCQCEI